MSTKTKGTDARIRALLNGDVRNGDALMKLVEDELAKINERLGSNGKGVTYAAEAVVVLRRGIEGMSARKRPERGNDDDRLISEWTGALMKRYSAWLQGAFEPEALASRSVTPDDILQKLSASKEFGAFEKRFLGYMLSPSVLYARLERYEGELGQRLNLSFITLRLDCSSESASRIAPQLEKMMADDEKMMEKLKGELSTAEIRFIRTGDKAKYAAESAAILSKHAAEFSRSYAPAEGEDARAILKWQNELANRFSAWLIAAQKEQSKQDRGASAGKDMAAELDASDEFSPLEKRFLKIVSEKRSLRERLDYMMLLSRREDGSSYNGIQRRYDGHVGQNN